MFFSFRFTASKGKKKLYIIKSLEKNTIVAQLFSYELVAGCFLEKRLFQKSHFLFFTKTLYISEYTDLDRLVNRLGVYNQFESWQYCENCHLLATNKMLPNFGNQKIQHNTSCICKRNRYSIPMVS